MPGGRMPKRRQQKAPFITKLKHAQWDSGAIRIEFFAGGCEEPQQRFLSEPYARELRAALNALLAEKPEPPIDGLKLANDGEHIRFTLLRGETSVASDRITTDVAEKAYKWLRQVFEPNVVRLKKR